MHPLFTPTPTPTPPNHPSAPPPSYDALRKHRAEALRAATHRAQRVFVVVNAVPFTTGIMLSCFTDVPAVSVHGPLTLGLVWGVLQCGLFVASAWMYETRSTRSGDALEESPAR